MPRYVLPNGKAVFSETEVPDAEMDTFFDEMETPEPAAPVAPIPEQRGLAGRAWDRANAPITDLPSRAVAPLAERMMGYGESGTGIGNKLGLYGGAFLKSLGNVATESTSPLNVGAALATGGGSLVGSKGLHAIGRGLDAVVAGHGLGTIADPNATWAERGMGALELGLGGKGALSKYKAAPRVKLGTNADVLVDEVQQIKPKTERQVKTEPIAEVIPESPAAAIPDPLPIQQVIPEPPVIPVSVVPEASIAQSIPPPEVVMEPGKITKYPPKVKEPYSVSNTSKAIDILKAHGADVEGLSNKDLIRMADEISPGFRNAEIPSVKQSPPSSEPKTSAAKSPMDELKAMMPQAPPKPKVKVKRNPVTNTLEPDLDDPLTKSVFDSAQKKQPVPDFERIDPDTELDLEDAIRMARAEQPGLGTALRDPVRATNAPDPMTAKASQPGLGDIAKTKTYPGGKAPDVLETSRVQEWLGIPRAIQSAFDLSFPLRQGLGLIHTKGWWKAWPDMIRSAGDEGAFRAVMDSIAERPNYRAAAGKKSFAQEAGLAITDLRSVREEDMMSSIAEKIPGIGRGIRASNRAYTAFANKLRADAFDDLIRKNPAAKHNIAMAKELASFVNNASGRGNLGALESSATALNNLLFSPRLMASRLQMMNPKNFIFARPQVRNEYLKSMLAMGATWGTIAGLGKMAGAEVSMDMDNSDFGKIKIGNTRLDPAGGFQQYIVLAHRMASGEFTSSTSGKTTEYGSKFGTPTRKDAIVDFVSNKFAPTASYANRFLDASKNRPFAVGDETMRMFTPIMAQAISEVLQDDPKLLGLTVPANLFGLGTNTFDKKGNSRLLGPLFPAKRDFMIPRSAQPR